MKEMVFIPKYPAKLHLGLIVSSAVEIYLLWQLLTGTDRSQENILVAIFFGVMIAILSNMFIKRIFFEKNAFSIEKYIGPTKTIEYADVVDIGIATIRTRKGIFTIPPMRNSIEFRNILAKRIEQSKRRPDN
jgi:hypothetical protein